MRYRGSEAPYQAAERRNESEEGSTLEELERGTKGDGETPEASSSTLKEAEISLAEKLKHPNCKGDSSQERSGPGSAGHR